jgi:hypothetical protein
MDINGTHIDIKGAVDKKLKAFRDTVCVSLAAQAETYAQDKAAWTDRTGNARRMLKGFVVDDGESLGIGIAHRATDEDTGEIYGKYLEAKEAYKILEPTAEHFKDEFFKLARETFGGEGGT